MQRFITTISVYELEYQCSTAQVNAECPAMSPHKIPWLFPDHFEVFPDHGTYHQHFVTALTLILQAIWQITH